MPIHRITAVLAVLAYGCGSSGSSDMSAGGGSSSTSNANGGAGSNTGANASSNAGGSSSTKLADATSCTGQEALCPSIAFGLCTEVQMAPGRCVDWSKSRATPCTSPSDCPGNYPTGNFGTATGTVRAICIKATAIEYTTTGNSPDSGYCAATEAVSDPSGTLNCSTAPCGDTGYCSYIRNAAGTSIVECTWAI